MPADTVDFTSLTLKKSIMRVDITANRDFLLEHSVHLKLSCVTA